MPDAYCPWNVIDDLFVSLAALIDRSGIKDTQVWSYWDQQNLFKKMDRQMEMQRDNYRYYKVKEIRREK